MPLRRSKAFPGMKAKPKAKDGRQNNGRKKGVKNKKYQGFINKQPRIGNSIKKDLKDDLTMSTKDFLRVRANETQPEWEERTQKRRVFGIKKDNNIVIAQDGKIKSYKKTLKGKKRELAIRLRTQFQEKPFDFLKCYAFVMRWAVVRFGIIKDDIELGYYFYEGKPFTKDEFNLACRRLGTVRGVFRRFWTKGYIMPFTIITRSGATRNVGYFCMTIEFNNLIKKIYGILSKTSKLTFDTSNGQGEQSEELMQMLLEMNTEIEEILEGLKKEETIIYKNEGNYE